LLVGESAVGGKVLSKIAAGGAGTDDGKTLFAIRFRHALFAIRRRAQLQNSFTQ
jgi:hypothetical protein